MKKINIIQVYALQQGRPRREKKEFYDLLQTTLDGVIYPQSLIACGNWNGHVESDQANHRNIIGKHGIGNRTKKD